MNWAGHPRQDARSRAVRVEGSASTVLMGSSGCKSQPAHQKTRLGK